MRLPSHVFMMFYSIWMDKCYIFRIGIMPYIVYSYKYKFHIFSFLQQGKKERRKQKICRVAQPSSAWFIFISMTLLMEHYYSSTGETTESFIR